MTANYRADHVGSFLRPPELLGARSLAAKSAADRERLQAVEDRHILQVIARQEELGFRLCTDGELRRRNFMSDFTDAVEGFDLSGAVRRDWQADQAQDDSLKADRAQADSKDTPVSGAGKTTPVSRVAGIVVDKLRAVRPLTGHELPFLMAHARGAIKMTLPSATQFPAIAFQPGVTDTVYPNRSALLWDIVEIMKAELARLASAGVQYIQIDAPRYSYFIDPKWQAFIRTEMKVEPDALLEESIQADNACLDAATAAACQPGVTLAMHLCRGNNRSHWYAEGAYDAIAEKLFASLHVDRFLLEYDDDRSGTFDPLRFVPKGKTVVLGLISSKRPCLEDPEELAWRIDEAARYVPLENLALSPQCGFASTAEGNLLSEEEQWAKLKLVVETARKVWSEQGTAA